MVFQKGVALEAGDPTYTAGVHDLELSLGQNMSVAGHQSHSMPEWLTNQGMDRELVDP